MKKNYILSLVCVVGFALSGTNAFAQYQKGDILLNPGMGLGYWYAGSGFAVGFTINAEFSITDDIAIGPYFAFTHWNYSYNFAGYDDISYNFIDFGARGSYHFARLLKVKNEKFDPYAGAFLGFVASTNNFDDNGYNDPYDGAVRGGLYAGARYYFSDKFGVFGEVGVGLYPVVLGVTFKLK
ncbi:MAG TPA: hypothetical protein VK589_00750 [Chryseolinea sp.]|nr:hypothetical protein [Chryseolinea sp.]